jgi:hypothetical protein
MAWDINIHVFTFYRLYKYAFALYKNKTNSVVLSPWENYTDWWTVLALYSESIADIASLWQKVYLYLLKHHLFALGVFKYCHSDNIFCFSQRCVCCSSPSYIFLAADTELKITEWTARCVYKCITWLFESPSYFHLERQLTSMTPKFFSVTFRKFCFNINRSPL